MMDDSIAGAFPFFLDAEPGQRFCLYHAPATDHARGAIVYVPPFAEELNKCRRMAAMQCRRFAHAGYAVMQIDPYGCGDSDGDFADARWPIWLRDLDLACVWMREYGHARPALWGARLGALLALDYAVAAELTPPALVLWQPTVSGRRYLDQFLRVERAARMLEDQPPREAATDSMQATVEVAGYALAPELMRAIGARDAAQLMPPCPVHWLEVDSADAATGDSPQPPPAIAASSSRLIDQWRAAGASVRAQAVAGPAFWASTETMLCPALLDVTTALELP